MFNTFSSAGENIIGAPKIRNNADGVVNLFYFLNFNFALNNLFASFFVSVLYSASWLLFCIAPYIVIALPTISHYSDNCRKRIEEKKQKSVCKKNEAMK